MPLAYFLLESKTPGHWHAYPHCSIALAEGFRSMGWRVGANRDDWFEDERGRRLFTRCDDREAREAGLVVVDRNASVGSGDLPEWLFDAGRRFRTVGVDMDDIDSSGQWYWGAQPQRLDVVLRTHCSGWFRYPSNVRPWAFGLCDRITDALRSARKSASCTPRSALGWNFQHKQFPHTVRSFAEKYVRPVAERVTTLDESRSSGSVSQSAYERMMWLQTSGRHSERYFEKLVRLKSVACFCGWMLPPIRQTEGGWSFRIGRAWNRWREHYSPLIGQWDSWRLWESFEAGAAVLFQDFERHRLQLPVRPVANKQYVSVPINGTSDEWTRVLADQARLAEIGQAGQAWVNQHYSPTAVAKRLVELLSK